MTSDLNPQPLPPRAVTALFLFQIAVRDLTSRLPSYQGTELTGRLDQAISDEIDFVCATFLIRILPSLARRCLPSPLPEL